MWERRYGVVEPERTGSGYRMYSDADVELLRRLRVLTERGTPISEASRLVPQLRREISGELKQRDELSQAEPLNRWKLEIIAAAGALDQPRIDRALDQAFSTLPPLQVVDDIILPALVEVGDLWHAGKLDVSQEHLATQALRGRVLTALHMSPNEGERHVIVACFPEEQHEMGALTVALKLRHAGVRVTYLGQRTPVAELGAMVRGARPDSVALSAVTDPGQHQFTDWLDALKTALPDEVPVLVGGRAAALYQEQLEARGFRAFGASGWAAAIDLLART